MVQGIPQIIILFVIFFPLKSFALRQMIESKTIGQTIELGILREDKIRILKVTLSRNAFKVRRLPETIPSGPKTSRTIQQGFPLYFNSFLIQWRP